MRSSIADSEAKIRGIYKDIRDLLAAGHIAEIGAKREELRRLQHLAAEKMTEYAKRQSRFDPARVDALHEVAAGLLGK